MIVLWLTGCPAPPPEPLTLASTELPVATAANTYRGRLETRGGVPPLRWTIEGDLPAGLVFNPHAGVLSGTPEAAGSTTLVLGVTDASGGSHEITVDLVVNDDRRLFSCGETIEGELTDHVWRPDEHRYDWSRPGAWERVYLRLPPDGVEHVQLELNGSPVIIVEDPVAPLGDIPTGVGFDWGVPIDAATVPPLAAYRARGAPLSIFLAAPYSKGTYELSATCTAGPSLVQTAFLPPRVGSDVLVDYDVVGDNDGVTFELVGEAPPWATSTPRPVASPGFPTGPTRGGTRFVRPPPTATNGCTAVTSACTSPSRSTVRPRSSS